VRHAVPEGNSSTMQLVDLIGRGILPDPPHVRRDYQPRHLAVETHPLTDRPTEEIRIPTEDISDAASDQHHATT
jgi:hypothetical protein